MKLTKLLTITFLTLFVGQVFGSQIKCTSERLGQTFQIEKTTVTFTDNDGRSLASVGTRTKMRGYSVDKILSYNNKRMTIHVDNKTSFSPLNDYVVLKNSRGHEITYPLDCQLN